MVTMKNGVRKCNNCLIAVPDLSVLLISCVKTPLNMRPCTLTIALYLCCLKPYQEISERAGSTQKCAL